MRPISTNAGDQRQGEGGQCQSRRGVGEGHQIQHRLAVTCHGHDLAPLDGIGEVRADAIIRARPFKAKTELVERRLIPESLYEKIADKVMARPPPAAPAPARPAPQKRT
mgnify:CR=1 FL=1